MLFKATLSVLEQTEPRHSATVLAVTSEFSQCVEAVGDVDADGVIDGSDNCQVIANPDQSDVDGEGLGDACDGGNSDTDELSDQTEYFCGSAPGGGSRVPERVDGSFVGEDEDGDTQVNEPLPIMAAGYDCDGDGFIETTEDHVTTSDQNPCGRNRLARRLRTRRVPAQRIQYPGHG